MGRGGLLVAHQSDQIKFPLAMRGVGEPYTKDASLKISGQYLVSKMRDLSVRGLKV